MLSRRFVRLALHSALNHSDVRCVKDLTGAMRDELPVARYGQHGAVLVGLDWTLFYLLAKFEHGSTTTVGKLDTVSAEVDSPSEGRLPLMPPDRWGMELRSTWRNFEYSPSQYVCERANGSYLARVTVRCIYERRCVRSARNGN